MDLLKARMTDKAAYVAAANQIFSIEDGDWLLPKHIKLLLEDFFEVCRYPNDAEKSMLAEACDFDSAEITEQWCK